jgi:hypothetical protein
MTRVTSLRKARVLLLAAATVILTACSMCGLNSKLGLIKPGMKVDQVLALLGNPTRIDETQTEDQTLTGQVYHYATPGGEGRIVFVNGTVFSATILPATKT